MNVSDLRVESASVYVTNAGQEGAKYRISSSIQTRSSKLVRIDNGNVILADNGKSVAYFNKDVESDKSYNVRFVGDVFDNAAEQCEINNLIHEYISLAENKSYQEIND